LYVFLMAACLCSNYMVASEKLGIKPDQNKAYYDKLLDDRIKDPAERAKYNEGYVVMSFGILPISEVYIPVSIGNDGCFMSFPINHPIHKELEERKRNSEAREISLTK
jgi:hypothetical protein